MNDSDTSREAYYYLRHAERIGRDEREIAEAIRGRLGITLTPERVAAILRYDPMPPLTYQDDDSIWMALKKRLGDAGETRGRAREGREPRPTCRLHVGFVCLEETPEMLVRLRNEREKPEAAAFPARSGVWKAAQIRSVRPIDRTAWRVAPVPP
jgi:hypothetical protein